MKNPWMSLWLSAANTWAGAARGFWTAEAVRQQKALARTAAKGAAPKRSRASAAKRKTAARRPRKAGS